MVELEQQILRSMLAALLDPSLPLSLPDHVPEDWIIKLARHHRLSPALSLVTRAADARVPASVAEAFDQDRLVTLGRTMMLRRTLVELLKAFRAADVNVVLLKGIAYEQFFYAHPGTRPASDIDLLAPRAKRAETFQIFHALGFHPTGGAPGFDEPSYHEVSLRRGDDTIDLHFGLAPFVRGNVDYESLWRDIVAITIDDAPAYMMSPPHMALNHALHMAIHHFDVPALYLLDLARLLSDESIAAATGVVAREWRCLRAWETSLVLMTAFIPPTPHLVRSALPREAPRQARIVKSFGGIASLRRAEQLRRKWQHFDRPTDAVLYLAVQGRRVLRERVLTLLGSASPAERLRW